MVQAGGHVYTRYKHLASADQQFHSYGSGAFLVSPDPTHVPFTIDEYCDTTTFPFTSMAKHGMTV